MARSLFICLGLCAAAALAAFQMCGGAGAQAAPRAPAAPVMVELFSSEGCSSCPPADAFLRELDRHPPLGSAPIYALEFHVDYWNDLGWQDPFSRREYSARQAEYARALGHGIFTPELIVQGQRVLDAAERVRPSDWLARAAAQPSAAVTLDRRADRVTVHVTDIPKLAGDDVAEVFVAVTELGLVSEVRAGENRGRELQHGPVVRALVRVGEARGPEFTGTITLALQPAWHEQALRFTAFVQARNARSILGAAQR
jgi:hypothetical protein